VHDNATVRAIAETASGGGLVITVQDQSGNYITPKPTGLQRIGPLRPIGTNPQIAKVGAWVSPSDLIALDQADPDVILGVATGNALHLRDDQVGLPGNKALPLGKPFGIDIDRVAYRAAASGIGDAQRVDSSVVALYPQHLLDSYARSVRERVALLMGLLLVLIGAGAALAVRSLTHTLRGFSDGIRSVS